MDKILDFQEKRNFTEANKRIKEYQEYLNTLDAIEMAKELQHLIKEAQSKNANQSTVLKTQALFKKLPEFFGHNNMDKVDELLNELNSQLGLKH
jgi:RNA polymerase-interacting CarD/CdnL/TRCF family regulator